MQWQAGRVKMVQFKLKGITLRIPEAQLSPALERALREGRYESGESDALLRNLEPGDRVLDLGAGAGYVSSLAARVVGGENVTAVEAAPDMLAVLRRNLNLNEAGNARVLHGAVVADDYRDEEVRFAVADAFWSSRLAEGAQTGQGATVKVPALRFGSLLAEIRPSVVVMDIEGGELEICRQDWPDCVRLLIMEIHTRRYPPADVKAMFDALSRNGFTYMPWGTRGEVVVQQRVR